MNVAGHYHRIFEQVEGFLLCFETLALTESAPQLTHLALALFVPWQDDGDCQKWANHWNNHKLSLHGHSASPLQIWMESQLLHGACGLEHLMPDDPRVAAPPRSCAKHGSER